MFFGTTVHRIADTIFVGYINNLPYKAGTYEGAEGEQSEDRRNTALWYSKFNGKKHVKTNNILLTKLD